MLFGNTVNSRIDYRGGTNMYLLGIDLGCTTVKAGVFTPSGKMLSLGKRPTPVVERETVRGKELVMYPEELWQSAVDSIREALAGIKDAKEVAGVSVCGFGSDSVPITENGEWLYPFISCRDRQTTEQMEEFISRDNDNGSYAIAGICPWFYLTAFRMMRLKKYEPEAYNASKLWLPAVNYINYRLSGEAATDYSEASTTLLFDQRNLRWSPENGVKAGVDLGKLPGPLPSGTPLGTVKAEAAEETGLPGTAVVVLGGHDNMTSYFAASESNDDFVVVTGTFESLMFGGDVPVIAEEGRKNNLICEKSVIPGQYNFWGVQYAGGVIEWMKKTFYPDTSMDELFSSLEGTDIGAGGLTMLPHILGSMSPKDDPYSKGVFTGISESTRKIDFLRAALEGINYQNKQICECLEKISGRNIGEVINIGGAANSGFWMQNRADILGKSLKVLNIPEATLLGASMIAGVGAGAFKNFEEARQAANRDFSHVHPRRENTAVYEDYYRNVFVTLYEATYQMNHYNRSSGR